MQKVDARQLERLRKNTTFNALSQDFAKQAMSAQAKTDANLARFASASRAVG